MRSHITTFRIIRRSDLVAGPSRCVPTQGDPGRFGPPGAGPDRWYGGMAALLAGLAAGVADLLQVAPPSPPNGPPPTPASTPRGPSPGCCRR